MQSGSLITARLASEMGREVLAIPGSIHAPQARGCHALIKQGAKLVQDWNDVFVDLPAEDRRQLAALCKQRMPDMAAQESLEFEPPREEMKQLLALIPRDNPTSLDALVEASGQSAAEALASLFEMEMSGMIRQLPGKQFVRSW